jgi:DNA polymerase-3 subunit chi
MTDINFYVSKQEGVNFRLAIVYRLVTLALQRNLSIHIHTENEEDSKKIDDFLWSKEKTSFIPHSIVDGDDENCKVSIAHDHEPLQNCDYLINFTNQRPSFFSRFLKVAEILDTSEEILTAGRKRYVFYKERGYTLGYHQL